MAKPTEDFARLEKTLREADYLLLENLLRDADLSRLAEAWARFNPLDKLVLFKLLDAPRALEFYTSLSFKEKYHLLCGFPLNSIAPILENLSAERRRLFVQLPREFYDRMFRQLATERVEMDVTVSQN